MKRLIIVLAVVAGILVACAYSLYKVKEIRDSVDSYAGAVFTAIDGRDQQAALAGVRELAAYWFGQESILTRYVRHAEVDDITKVISRLESLASFGSYDHLSAELSAVVSQVNHIWKSEKPELDNIL